MNNCRQFEIDLIRNDYDKLKKLLRSKKNTSHKIDKLKNALKNKSTSIVKGMQDLCSLKIYKLSCANMAVTCGSSEWDFGTGKEAQLFFIYNEMGIPWVVL